MKANNSFHSSLALDLKRYVSLKQALGRKFENASSILLKLDQFLCSLGEPAADLTAETFNQWAQTMESLCSNTRLARLRLVRNFCLYRQRTEPGCFVPDPTEFPQSGPTAQPYIFSDGEVERLLSHIAALPNSARSPLRGDSTRLAIILLYTTGMRRGELLRLTPSDYDPSAQRLSIRASKFHKSRLLPLPGDVAAQVTQFLQLHQAVGLGAEIPLLCSPYRGHDEAYSSTQLRKNLSLLLSMAGIKKTDGRLPRIHDFRFSFAANALLRWYRDGVDVQAKLPYLAAWMGHVSIVSTYHYLRFAACLRDYFTDHLPRLRGLSPNTVVSYRDSLVLLLRFLARERKRQACDLDLDEIEPDQVLAFLNHLEQDRRNSVPTRNVRLAAIHAFFRYVGARHPDQLERAQRILGVPFKRGQQRAVEYLEQDEIEAILSRIERSTPSGRRDYVLLATMFNTGARVQEVIDLRACDLQLTHPYQLRLLGKGRKERFCPLWPQTAQVLRELCEERGIDLRSETRLFLNQRGGALTRFGVR